jgi:hypothetical protein
MTTTWTTWKIWRTWRGEDDFPAMNDGNPNLAAGALGFVLDPPQLLEQMRQDVLEEFIGEEVQEDEGKYLNLSYGDVD